MFEINKQQFGTFVAQLRKEKGLTQKELAEKLYVSDKAVSKWETAVSIPDTALLVPLAEELGVSVTELLLCRRVEALMDTDQVEDVVQTAIHYREERMYRHAGKWTPVYVLCAVFGIAAAIWCWFHGRMTATTPTYLLLGLIFGAYFCFFAKTRLPDYYDKNRINGMIDGPFRMNMPGMVFNNNNWPYILRAGRIWACVSMVLFSGADLLALPMPLWLGLTLCLGGLFVPMYVVGIRYQ